jgi:hypothetical protein
MAHLQLFHVPDCVLKRDDAPPVRTGVIVRREPRTGADYVVYGGGTLARPEEHRGAIACARPEEHRGAIACARPKEHRGAIACARPKEHRGEIAKARDAKARDVAAYIVRGKELVLARFKEEPCYGLLCSNITPFDEPIACIRSLMRTFGIPVRSDQEYVDYGHYRIYIFRIPEASVSGMTKVIEKRSSMSQYTKVHPFPVNGSIDAVNKTMTDSYGEDKRISSDDVKMLLRVKERIGWF